VYDERCDACPGVAVVVVLMTTGRELVLCGNHARRYAPHLLEAGAAIIGDYSFEAGLRPAVDIRVAPPAEGEALADKAEPGTGIRAGRWQRFFDRFKN